VKKIMIYKKEAAGVSGAGSALKEKIDSIAGVLLGGGVIILPASTIYGLSCCYDNSEAVKRIYSIKNRRAGMPFIVLISGRDQLQKLACRINSTAEKIMENFWEGKEAKPLTLIFKKRKSPGTDISGVMQTIAVRIAGPWYVRQIIKAAGPIVSTSATISGAGTKPAAVRDIPARICKSVDMIVESEVQPGGIESTVIDVTGPIPLPVREGAVKFESITAKLR
jgi:L-threonylcarbamoyladenylate synthase